MTLPRWRLPGILASLLLMACSPQIIYMKDRVIVAPPPAGWVHDKFFFNKPSGALDVVVVMDNSVPMHNGIGFFRQTYETLLGTLETSPGARLLDFRVQVATGQSGRSPRAVVKPREDPSSQVSELFGDILNPDWHSRETGAARPFAVSLSALAGNVLKDRPFVSLFLVHVLGSEADSGDLMSLRSFETGLDATRGLYQSHLMALTRGSDSGFPACDDFSRAPSYLSATAQVHWSSVFQADLCDGSWQDWQSRLVSTILTEKTRLVLSRIPYLPESMILTSPSHRAFRYGDDYRLDPAKNEIIFTTPPGLEDGDLIEATYQLAPITNPLGGNPGN